MPFALDWKSRRGGSGYHRGVGPLRSDWFDPTGTSELREPIESSDCLAVGASLIHGAVTPKRALMPLLTPLLESREL